MASKNTAAVLDEDLDTEAEAEAELTEKQIINEGIMRVIEVTGIDVQKNRYKAMRAIAFEAFAQAIAENRFDELVDEALANLDSLPSGWEIERVEKVAEVVKPVKAVKAVKFVQPVAVKKAPVKKAVAKPAAVVAEVKAVRRRPVR